MIGTFINAGLILLGSLIGLLFKNRISQRFSAAVTGSPVTPVSEAASVSV